MIQNPNWSHRDGSLCLLKYQHLFLIGLKNTTMDKDLLYFQLCFSNNTGIPTLWCVLSPFSLNHCTHVHFLVQPRDETSHQLKLFLLVGSIWSHQATADPWLFTNITLPWLLPIDVYILLMNLGAFSNFMDVFTFVPALNLRPQVWRLRVVDITQTHNIYIYISTIIISQSAYDLSSSLRSQSLLGED